MTRPAVAPERPRVWAPDAREVVLVLAGVRVPMARGDGGWWEADPDGWGTGTEYAFLVDGEGPFPDPRSLRQPRGVHGPSQAVAARPPVRGRDAFRAPPLASGVVYELHVGTFTPEGTFGGAARRLDALAELGVTHVELMPVAGFPGDRGWGYDGVSLFAPHEAYGGPEGLRTFVEACHEKGLAVLLDVVYNHLGPEGNYLDRFGPYFTARYGTPWGKAVNLDGRGSDEVRRFLLDNALMWLEEYGIDGLRLDAVHALFDGSALHFLEELAREVRALEARTGRPLALVAESDLNDPRLVTPPEAGGYGLDGQWSDDLHHAVHAVLTGEDQGYYRDFGTLAHVAKALRRGFVYDGGYSKHRGRRHGRPFPGDPGARLLGYLQTHDQVGNRARGERIGALTGGGRLRIGAALVLTAPFVPLLFQGEEWAASTPFLYFTDLGDPKLTEAVRQGRRREFAAFGWKAEDIPDPQAQDTFLRSRLDWCERGRSPHAELLAWYRALLALRRTTPELLDGRVPRVRFDEEEGWLVVERGPVTVACNLSGRTRRIPLDRSRSHALLLTHPEGLAVEGAALALPPDGVAVLAPRG